MEIFSASIVGYKNKIKRNQSQDYIDYKFIDNGVICAVADGHSTDFFKYSDVGSRYACKAAIEVLESVEQDFYKIKEMLYTRYIQKQIYLVWRDMVNEHYKKNNPLVYKTEYIKYSTTLIVAMVTSEYKIYLKLGDGGIVEKNNYEFKKILDLPIKPIVDSLGREDIFLNMVYDIRPTSGNESNLDWIMIFTDGYENSYCTNEKLYNSFEKTISKYKNNVFSRSHLKSNYKNYLDQLSKDVSYDDISIIFIGL